MDINSLVTRMRADGTLTRVARNPLAQFGTPQRRYLGATLLPELPQDLNEYTEDAVRYRTVIANDGTRYSPVQLKSGALSGSMSVKLAEQDIGNIFTAREYEILRKLLGRNDSLAAIASLVRWSDTTLNLALVEKIERMRWQAIVGAVVPLTGDNEYVENVAYSNPAGSRVAAAAAWSNNATDPFLDIFGMMQKLVDKGYTVNRIVSSQRVVGIMAGNAIVRTRTNRVMVSPTGQIQSISGRATLADINGALAADGLPPIETYDLQFRTNSGTGRFLPNDVMVFLGTTGRNAELDLGDTIQIVPETLGYVGVGTAAGQSGPGRIINLFPKEDKPVRIEAEAYQTSLPVITEPEAIGVITGIA